MEYVSMLASSRFLVKRLVSKKFSRWKIVWKELFLGALSRCGIFRFLQTLLLCFFTFSTILPVLICIQVVYRFIQYLIFWKIKTDQLAKDPNFTDDQVVSKFCKNDSLATEMLETFILISTGNCDFSTMKSDFERNYVDEKMRMILSFQLGVPVWRTDPNFKIDNHFILSSGRRKNGEVLSEQNLTKYLSEMKTDQKNLPLNQAPWQIVVVPFEYTQGHAIIFHTHPLLAYEHSIVSRLLENEFLESKLQRGPFPRYSVIKTYLKESAEKCMVFLKSYHKSLSDWQRFLNTKSMGNVRFSLFKLFYLFLSGMCVPRILFMEFYHSSCLSVDANPLKAKKSLLYPRKNELRKTVEVAWSEPVSLELLETIADDSRKSVQDVLIACCSGSLHSYLGKYVCVSPEDIMASVLVPFTPLNADPRTHSEISLKMASGMSDSRNRLNKTAGRRRLIERNWLKILVAGFIIDSQIMITFLPGFMVSFVKRLLHRKHALSLAQSKANMDIIRTVFGKEVSRVLHLTRRHSKIGLHLSLIKHDDSVTLCVQSNTTVAPEAQLVTTGFVREVYELASWFGIYSFRSSPQSSPRSFNRIPKYPKLT